MKRASFAAVLGLLPAFSLAGGAAAAGPDTASAVIEQAEKELAACQPGPTGGEARGKLHEKIGDAERERDREIAASDAYRQALSDFASAGAEKLRAGLLGRLAQPGQHWSKKAATPIVRRKEAWERVIALRREVRRLPRLKEPPVRLDPRLAGLQRKCAEIEAAAVQEHDQELKAWVGAVRGRLAAAGGDPRKEILLLREGAGNCMADACPKIRRRLLLIAARLLERQGELEEAFRLFAASNSEVNSALPEEERLHGRSKSMVRVCQELRAKADSPSCQELEMKATGSVTYRDFSTEREKEMLSPADIEEVHGEYLPLLRDCLLRAAKAGEIEPGKTLVLDWTVTNDGRADHFSCEPAVDGLLVRGCFQRALDLFRYPPYRGERRNISLPLSVDW